MRLATVFYLNQNRVVAAIDDNSLLDLAAATGSVEHPFGDMLSLIDAGEAGLALARQLMKAPKAEAILNMSDVEFRTPIVPTQYRDCLVFEQHLINGFAQAEKMTGTPYKIPKIWYEQPIYYKGNRMSFIGHQQKVVWPAYSDYLDIELELAIVIGKQGKDIAAKDAASHIFGYTILNDVSARDAQMAEMDGKLGPAKGKDFDTGNILGPYILTADEVAHPAALKMQARVNGEVWGGGTSADMYHNFADIIAFISRSETLYAGEVIGSGTVGTGCGLEIGKRLAPNDVFELEIENIGTLVNQIVKADEDE
uniref:Fumarylacetoacetate hydrolase n=1 Tax=OCS116 cluster bacterium TaxID=2030921 RepID=A0A2A4YXG5_9PROT